MLVALLVCLIPTTIGALLSAIGIAGMDRLVQRNVLAMSGRAVEAAGDVNVLLLDKTGTITLGNRQATEFLPVDGVEAAASSRTPPSSSSLADETPEGRSIVVLAKRQYGLRERRRRASSPHGARSCRSPPQTRMSGVDLDGRPADPQGRRRGGDDVGARATAATPTAEVGGIVDAISAGWRHAARRRRAVADERGPGARRRPPQGRRQGGHARALRRDARAWASAP